MTQSVLLLNISLELCVTDHHVSTVTEERRDLNTVHGAIRSLVSALDVCQSTQHGSIVTRDRLILRCMTQPVLLSALGCVSQITMTCLHNRKKSVGYGTI